MIVLRKNKEKGAAKEKDGPPSVLEDGPNIGKRPVREKK